MSIDLKERSSSSAASSRWPSSNAELADLATERIEVENPALFSELSERRDGGWLFGQLVGSLVAVSNGAKARTFRGCTPFDTREAQAIESALQYTFYPYQYDRPTRLDTRDLVTQKRAMQLLAPLSDVVIAIAQEAGHPIGTADYTQLRRLRSFATIMSGKSPDEKQRVDEDIERAALRPVREHVLDAMVDAVAENQQHTISTYPRYGNVLFAGAPLTYDRTLGDQAIRFFMEHDSGNHRHVRSSQSVGLATGMKSPLRMHNRYGRDNAKYIELRSYGFASPTSKTLARVSLKELAAAGNQTLLDASSAVVAFAVHRKEVALECLRSGAISSDRLFGYRAQDAFLAAHRTLLKGLAIVSPGTSEQAMLREHEELLTELQNLESRALRTHTSRLPYKQKN